MDPLDPRHGTYAGSQAHQKDGTPPCEPCNQARKRYQKRLDYDHDQGVARRIPPTLATRHIRRLIDAGLTVPEIARRAGVAKGTVYRASDFSSYETPPTMLATNIRAILTVQPDGGATAGYMPRLGVNRRIQALNAIGWPRNVIAEMLDMAPHNLTQLVNGCRGSDHRPNTHVNATTWHRVNDLYQELHMTPGPSAESRRRAARKGYAPPMSWENIDDPNERPVGAEPLPTPKRRHPDDIDPTNVDRLVSLESVPNSTRAEKEEALRRWLAAGRSELSLCGAHGWRQGRYAPNRTEDAA